MKCHQKTREYLLQVKEISEKHPGLTAMDISKMLGRRISDTTVRRILRGDYDDDAEMVKVTSEYSDTIQGGDMPDTSTSRITRETVEKVKEIHEKYPMMSGTDIADLTQITSRASVCRIINGDYDHLLGTTPAAPQSSTSYSVLTEEVRTFREQWMRDAEDRHNEIMDVLKASNNLLADIATLLVNSIECTGHTPSKASESHFRDAIKKNRIK